MDAIKAAFESQFGTDWSTPAVNSHSTIELDDNLTESKSPRSRSSQMGNESPHREGQHTSDIKTMSGGSDQMMNYDDHDSKSDSDGSDSDGPITVIHDDNTLNTTQQLVTKSQRRKFMNSGAPRDDTQVGSEKADKETDENLKNDLALQRLIEESHILHEGQQFSGAEISGAADPLETVGKSRLKIMNARLQKAGAKVKKDRIPQAMAVGIRDKAADRRSKYKEEARNAGIILAKDRHIKSKNKRRDTGLKINAVGKASEYGIHVSPAEIARLSSQGKRKGKSKFKK